MLSTQPTSQSPKSFWSFLCPLFCLLLNHQDLIVEPVRDYEANPAPCCLTSPSASIVVIFISCQLYIESHYLHWCLLKIIFFTNPCLPPSFWPLPHCDQCQWIMHKYSLAIPFTFFHPVNAPPLTTVSLFHVSMLIFKFHSSVYFGQKIKGVGMGTFCNSVIV